MKARIRDTEIFFDIDGMGLVPNGAGMLERPIAFLVHGGPGSDHSSLKERYGSLSEAMQLIYFDFRGNGRSARGDSRRYTLDENVEDMEALRQYLGLEKIVSVGASYGGKVAMAHAARFPDAVSHLVLVATVAHHGYVARAQEIVAQRGSAEQIAQCDALFSGRIDTQDKLRHYYDVMESLYSYKNEPSRTKAGFERTIFSSEALNLAHGPGGYLRSFDLRPELNAIKAATLVVAGRYDWICPPEFAEEIHSFIPGSELLIFEECGHLIGSDKPLQLLEAIDQFIVGPAKERGLPER